MYKIIIAVDGYSSCGKSTLAKGLAKRLGYVYVDTGAMYRATTLHFIRNGIDLTDEGAVDRGLSEISITFRNVGGQNRAFLNDEDVEDEIRGMEVSEMVSPVAAISAVRRRMVEQQRLMGQDKGLVMDGRDIGTVVFPRAELKIFLTADTEVRAKRRLDEMVAKGVNIRFQDIKKNLRDRDRIDTSRKDSPLRKAEDAVEIDNTHLSKKEQENLTLELALKRIEKHTEESRRLF